MKYPDFKQPSGDPKTSTPTSSAVQAENFSHCLTTVSAMAGQPSDGDKLADTGKSSQDAAPTSMPKTSVIAQPLLASAISDRSDGDKLADTGQTNGTA